MSTRFATAKCVMLSLTAFLGLSLVAGCGSGGRTVGMATSSTATRSAKGSITLNVTWPERPTTVAGRVIPIASNYIVITATPVDSTGTPIAGATPTTGSITRPTTTTTLSGLLVGVNYLVTAAAYPDASGSNAAQASGSMSTVTPISATQPNAQVNVTMFATVKSLVLSPTTVQLQLGAKTTVTATALDVNGNPVITTTGATSSIVFTSADPSIVSITRSGNTATLTASSTKTGSTTIGAQYVENSVPVGSQGTGAAATLTATVTTAGIGVGDWPKFHGNVGNTGQVPASVPTVALTGYTAPYPANVSLPVNGSIVYSSPTFNKAGTIMYIGADDGYVYALNINANGFVGTTFRWAFKTGGAIEGAPLVDVNDNVFVGSADGNLYAIKDVPGVGAAPASAQQIYKFAAGAAITGSPTIDNKGTIYFTTEPTYNGAGAVTTPGKLFFVDSLSGAAKTLNGAAITFSGDSVGYNTTPALDTAQDLVYVSSEAGIIYSVSTTNGLVRAQYPLSGDTISQSSPVVATVTNGTEVLYQGTTNGKLYQFRAAAINDGPIAGFTTYTATGSILATPAFNPANNVLVVATYDNSSGQNDSRVAVVDANSGVEIARTTPILTFLTQRDGVLTQADINQAQAFLFASSPAISSDGTTAYVGCEDGHVYSINIAGLASGATPTGTYLPFKSLIETNGNSQINPILVDSSPGVDLRGHVFIGGLDGSVYAISK